MERLVLALMLVGLAVGVALVVQRRSARGAPTRPSLEAPAALDRADLAGSDHPWLLVAFTSDRCGTCADVVEAAAALRDPDVGLAEVEYGRARPLHERYGVGAVPLLVLVDRAGTVRWHRFGPTDLEDIRIAVEDVRGGVDPPGLRTD